jgi:hypothetical protein
MSETFKKATKVIEKFGGIRPMAQKLDVPVTTVQGWKKRNNIPENRVDQILKAAKEHNISLDNLTASNANTNDKDAASNTGASVRPEKKADSPVEASLKDKDGRMEQMYEGEEAVAFAKNMHTRNMRNGLLGGTALVVSLIALAGVYFATPEQTNNGAEQDALAQFEQQLDETQMVVNRQNEEFSERISSLEAGSIQLRSMIDERVNDIQSQSANIDSAVFDRLQSDIESLSVRVQENTVAAQAYDELNNVVIDIQNRVGNLDAGLDQAMSNLQSGDITGADLKAATLMVSLGYLRMMLNRSEPFAADYALMREWVGAQNDPELAAALDNLAPYATEGILSAQQLKASLLDIANDVVDAGLKGQNVSITEKITAQLNQLVSVKKDGIPVTGTQTDDKLQQAVGYLDNNQVAGAIATLNTLDPSIRQMLNPWFSQARGNLAAQNAYTTMSDKVFEIIKSSSQGASPAGIMAPSR